MTFGCCTSIVKSSCSKLYRLRRPTLEVSAIERLRVSIAEVERRSQFRSDEQSQFRSKGQSQFRQSRDLGRRYRLLSTNLSIFLLSFPLGLGGFSLIDSWSSGHQTKAWPTSRSCLFHCQRLGIPSLVAYCFFSFSSLKSGGFFDQRSAHFWREEQTTLLSFLRSFPLGFGGFLPISELFFSVLHGARKLSAHNCVGFPPQFPLG